MGGIVLVIPLAILLFIVIGALWLAAHRTRSLRTYIAAAEEREKRQSQRITELEAELKQTDSAKCAAIQELADAEARISALQTRYADVEDASERLRVLRLEQEDSLTAHKELLEKSKIEIAGLVHQYEQSREIYDRLRAEIALLEENLEDLSFGLYKPHYSFATSEEYRRELDAVRETKKRLNREGKAATCAVEWAIGGNRREGERMTKQQIKVMLRAFNGECDAALAKVTWNNIEKMELRLTKAYDAINELGSINKTSITADYLAASLAELRLAYEFAEKKQEEAEEQRRIREQMKEEERAQREYERAQQEAANEEARYQKALEKARNEMEHASGQALLEFAERVSDLEQKLAQAQAQKERATSMAQLTKSGHVYVISNIGSFGEDVYKIGMTRRLEPSERIDELGGASVPFRFDVHAMIYAEDAPALENAFHREFHDRRLNAINHRKEFFRVSLSEIEEFAKLRRGVSIEFTKLAEARQYRETLALRAVSQTTTPSVPDFPSTLSSLAASH